MNTNHMISEVSFVCSIFFCQVSRHDGHSDDTCVYDYEL